MSTTYKIESDLKQINANSNYCCGVEKWDTINICYGLSDFQHILNNGIENKSQSDIKY